jgi:phosphatidylglycerol lysyltransferase
VLLVAALLGPVERHWGSRRTALVLLVCQPVTALAGTGAVALLRETGDRWGQLLAAAVVTGPLPAVLAAVALSSATATPLLRRRLRVVLGVGLVMLVLYAGTAGDVHRLAGWGVGLLAGEVVLRVRGRRREHGPVSRRESRALVALVVAAAAVGPLVAALSRTPEGPWAVVSHLFVSGRPGAGLLRQVCGGGDPADCRVLMARSRLTGPGPGLLSVLPVLVQLVLAEGLRRGRRAAWVGAVVFSGALTAVGTAVVVAVLHRPAEALTILSTPRAGLPVVALWAPLAAPGAVLVLLLLTRSRFAVPAAPGTARRWAGLAAGGLALVLAAYLGTGVLLRSDWAQPPTVARLLLDLPARMVPPGYLGEVLPRLAPLRGAARVLADWTGMACWAVLAGTAWAVVRPAVPRGDAVRARELVTRHGEGAMSFMTTWTGNRWWFTGDGEAVVAFRVVGGVALTTGDPVGPPAARARAVPEFTAWCLARGWTPCWYSVTDAVVEALPGARRVQVASETWLPLGGLAFVGRRWQDVRTAMNRAARGGVQAVWVRWADAPLALREQVARSSEEWLAGKGLPEMGFTLGGLDELADPAVRCLLAVDPDGRVHGVTSWLPASRDGVRVGWTLDLMRRSPGCPPGTMEFLVGTAVLAFQAEGAEFVSLSGAPLALPGGADPEADGLARLLQTTGRLMEPVYGFRSLLSFKAKFQPLYRPLWLVHLDTADLPRIAGAVSRAYLPHLSVGQALRLGRTLLAARRPERVPPPAPPATPSSPELAGAGAR